MVTLDTTLTPLPWHCRVNGKGGGAGTSSPACAPALPPSLLLCSSIVLLCLGLYSNCRPPLKAQSIWASFDIKMSNNSISVQTQIETIFFIWDYFEIRQRIQFSIDKQKKLTEDILLSLLWLQFYHNLIINDSQKS